MCGQGDGTRLGSDERLKLGFRDLFGCLRRMAAAHGGFSRVWLRVLRRCRVIATLRSAHEH